MHVSACGLQNKLYGFHISKVALVVIQEGGRE